MADSTMYVQKQLALGKEVETGASDVQALASLSQGNSYSDASRAHLPDHKRGDGKPVKHTRGEMPSQAGVDHGPHDAS